MTRPHSSFHHSDAARPHARVRLCLCLLIFGVIVELATPAPAAAATPATPVNATGIVTDFFYHTDDLYNVMAITDETGAVADAGNERYEYADYGQPVDPITLDPIEGDPSSIGNPYLFTGRRYDPEIGWYYYRTRYLDPTAGRFTTRDAIGTWDDRLNVGNSYTYVGNSPWAWLDPFGLEGIKVDDERKRCDLIEKEAKNGKDEKGKDQSEDQQENGQDDDVEQDEMEKDYVQGEYTKPEPSSGGCAWTLKEKEAAIADAVGQCPDKNDCFGGCPADKWCDFILDMDTAETGSGTEVREEEIPTYHPSPYRVGDHRYRGGYYSGTTKVLTPMCVLKIIVKCDCDCL